MFDYPIFQNIDTTNPYADCFNGHPIGETDEIHEEEGGVRICGIQATISPQGVRSLDFQAFEAKLCTTIALEV